MTEIDHIVDRLESEVQTLPEQKNQCIQHLIELGYIPLGKVNAMLDSDIEKAKADFMEEARQSVLYTETELTQYVFQEDEEFLAELLEKACDIDEGFVFKSLPENGDQNLVTRIIHYRLDIFGLWDQEIGSKFSIIYSMALLKQIAEYANCNALEGLNLLADVEGFTHRLLKEHKEEKFILSFKSQNPVSDELSKELDRRGKFKKQLIEDFGDRSNFFKYLNRNVIKSNPKKIDFDFLRKESLDPFKKFVLRLIQVHQWQDGLYDGLLDSDMGELTIKSIMNSVELYNLADRKNIKMFRVLTYIDNGYFLFNALFFLQEYMVEDEQNNRIIDAEDKVIEDLMTSAEQADNPALAAFQLNIDVMKMELQNASKKQPEEKKGFLKRIYFGIKKFFKKIINISKKIFNWVVSLAKKFWGLLKKIFGHFFKQLAAGIKAFVDGIKFLLGKKGTLTTDENSVVASTIRIDGDAFCYVSGESPAAVVSQHIKKVRYSVTSLDFALKIVAGVVNIVTKAISIVSWPILIFSIIKIFKTISEAYKNIEFTTT